MTSIAAATAVLVLSDRAVLAANMFTFTPEIIRMAGSAKGCVLVTGPGDSTTDRSAMASITPRVPSVVAGIVSIGRGDMAEAGRCPAVGGMAYIALKVR